MHVGVPNFCDVQIAPRGLHDFMLRQMCGERQLQAYSISLHAAIGPTRPRRRQGLKNTELRNVASFNFSDDRQFFMYRLPYRLITKVRLVGHHRHLTI